MNRLQIIGQIIIKNNTGVENFKKVSHEDCRSRKLIRHNAGLLLLLT